MMKKKKLAQPNKELHEWYKALDIQQRKYFVKKWMLYTGRSKSSFNRYLYGTNSLTKENILTMNVLAAELKLIKSKQLVIL